jgi:lysophospholipase L1-like esterase
MNRKKFIQRSALFALGTSLTGFSTVNKEQQAGTFELLVNAGISGNNTNNLLKRMDTDCLVHKPTLTIMMAGTNDMNHGKFVPPAKFKTNLEKLVSGVTASGSHCLLMSILPFYEPYLLTRHPAVFFEPEGPAGRRTEVNNIIRSVAGAQKACSFFDIGALFEKVGKIGIDKDCLLRNEANSGKTDGVHPTPNGYRFMALAVSQYILFNNLPASRIVCFGDSITRGDGSTDKESYPAYLKKLLQ